MYFIMQIVVASKRPLIGLLCELALEPLIEKTLAHFLIYFLIHSLSFSDNLFVSYPRICTALNVFVALCSPLGLCFHSFSFCDNDFCYRHNEFVENKQLDHESTIFFLFLNKQFPQLLYKSNKATIL